MKKIITILVLPVIFISCGRKHKNSKAVKEERIEIVPFYINEVYTQDLHFIDTNLYLVEPQEFLNKEQFKTFKEAIRAMIKDPKSRLLDSPLHVYSKEELKDRFFRCDSITESSFDANGNENITRRFMCDSTSAIDNAVHIRFFESWYLNTKTNLIEKETLGYAVWSYVPSKEAFRELFVVFRDDKAMEKCKLYEYADQ